MTSEPTVTVITIFLNAEEFIRESVESVLAQTYDSWELLLVDDGSTDASTALAREYAQRYPDMVRYLEHFGHQNRGMSASRNLGIANARGEYIAFLDADDVWLPLKLERQVAILDSQPEAAMVYGATQHWYSWTGKPDDQHRDRLRKLGVPTDTLVRPPTLVTLFLRHEAWTPGTCGVLVRRDVSQRVGGFDERFRGMFEDQVFFYKLCLVMPVFVESGCSDRYRQHPDSWCEMARQLGEYEPGYQPNSARRAFLSWLEEYLLEQEITNRELHTVLRRELRPYRHPVLFQLAAHIDRVRRLPGALRRAARSIKG